MVRAGLALCFLRVEDVAASSYTADRSVASLLPVPVEPYREDRLQVLTHGSRPIACESAERKSRENTSFFPLAPPGESH